MARALSGVSSALCRFGLTLTAFSFPPATVLKRRAITRSWECLKLGKWSGLVSAQVLATDGYILIAPSVRGPIDQPYNVHAQNALTEFDRGLSHDGRIFLRGSVLNEDRHNGTPIQINSTRLWRYAGGADWSNLVVRLFGDNEHYSQTFSTINATRTAETLTRIGKDPADELGAAGHWHQPVGTHLLLLAGADIHDVRAADYETLFTASKGYLNTTARQRQSGVYGEVLFTPTAWTLSASGRVDHFSNFDASQYKTATAPLTVAATEPDCIRSPHRHHAASYQRRWPSALRLFAPIARRPKMSFTAPGRWVSKPRCPIPICFRSARPAGRRVFMPICRRSAPPSGSVISGRKSTGRSPLSR